MLVLAFSTMFLTAIINFHVGGPCPSLTIVLCYVQAIKTIRVTVYYPDQQMHAILCICWS